MVDGHGRVKVKTNWYSTPLWPGLRVTARVWPSRVEIEHDGECVARHQRCYGRGHQILNLEHDLDVLEKKPGAMAGSTPLEQWRRAGRWPECLDQIWKKLEQRHGRGGGTREMISLVGAGLNDGWDRLIAAVREALRLGCVRGASEVGERAGYEAELDDAIGRRPVEGARERVAERARVVRVDLLRVAVDDDAVRRRSQEDELGRVVRDRVRIDAAVVVVRERDVDVVVLVQDVRVEVLAGVRRGEIDRRRPE